MIFAHLSNFANASQTAHMSKGVKKQKKRRPWTKNFGWPNLWRFLDRGAGETYLRQGKSAYLTALQGLRDAWQSTQSVFGGDCAPF
jgi:hypothetical protein